jgi:hypothetical protein
MVESENEEIGLSGSSSRVKTVIFRCYTMPPAAPRCTELPLPFAPLHFPLWSESKISTNPAGQLSKTNGLGEAR